MALAPATNRTRMVSEASVLKRVGIIKRNENVLLRIKRLNDNSNFVKWN